MADYLPYNKFLLDIIISRERNELSEEAVKDLLILSKEMTNGLSYKYPTDREDCIQMALFDILKYWKGFNPQIKNSNVFSYYTQMVKNGLAKGWKEIKPLEVKDTVNTRDITNL